ncbi:hypothetical protein QAD02_009669 [Eretmocerus hayati]|uniref:Uncharacterized protein n=1 Tax=Eretmocerus hayati TaxID=131215 RepID=A0ACC2NBD4_9HYME|nr:hypothetical protein QAD02_009669 [Eretmocerus hayati]
MYNGSSNEGLKLLQRKEVSSTIDSTSFPGAASLGDVDLVKRLIKSGRNVNARDSDGSISLHLAISSGKDNKIVAQIVKQLIKAGASVNARNKRGYTPLHVATIYSDTESVYQLLEAGADADAEIDAEGVTCLRIVYTSMPSMEVGEILFMLSRAGASGERGNVRGPNRISHLRRAILAGRINEVRKLIRDGADVNAINWHGKTNLHTAVETDKNDEIITRIIKILLEAGAFPNFYDFDQRHTPLHAATIFGSVKRVELLINAGANLEAMTINCFTSLHLAISSEKCDNENFDLIQFLVKSGASLDQPSGKGFNALQTAISVEKVNVVEYLIQAGADVNKVHHTSATCLHTAIEMDINDEARTKIISLLLNSGITLKTVNVWKGSPLYNAVKLGRVKAVELLIKAGADVHEKFSKKEETCLHAIVKFWSGKNDEDRLTIIRLLVDAGASMDSSNSEKLTPLHCAIDSGNVKIVEMLIQAGANINTVTPLGQTSLHRAILAQISEENRSKIVSLLLKSGASPDAPSDKGQSSFALSILQCRVPVVQQLIKAGADVNLADSQGRISLHLVAQLKNNSENVSKIFNILLESGASLSKCNNHGRTPLHFAVCLSDSKGVERFIEAGADVNATDKLGQTSLHLTIRSDDKNDTESLAIAKLLVKAGVSIDCLDDKGNTPLHVAVITGKVQTTKWLIEVHLVDVNAADSKGLTSLHLLSTVSRLTNDHTKIIKLLLSAGASLDSRNKEQFFNPLHCAVTAGNTKLVEILIKIGADVNAASKNLRTSLHLALCLSRKNESSHQIIQLLLNSKASIHVRSKAGLTALIYAVSFGDAKLLEQLLKAGGDAKVITTGKKQTCLHFVFSTDEDADRAKIISILLKAGTPLDGRDGINNQIPLHYAVTAGDVRSVEQLIRAGADIHTVDKNGMTCLHLAFRPVKKELEDRIHGIVRLLLKAGSKIEANDKDGKTPLVHAVILGNAKCIQQLIRSGANAKVTDNEGLSILHHAVRSPMFVNECFDVIPLLLEAGTSLESRDQNGLTPLTFAAAHGCTQLVEALIESGADVNATDLEDRTVLHHVLDNDLSHSVSVETKRKIIRLLMGSGAERQSTSYRAPTLRLLKTINVFHQKCKDELSLMQTSIANTSTTFYQILVKKEISSYMRNEHIIEGFKKKEYIKLFPIFGEDLEKSFLAIQARRNLMDQASQGLYCILGQNNDLINDKILMHLNDRDLRSLRDMMTTSVPNKKKNLEKVPSINGH